MINVGDLILLWRDERHSYVMKAQKGRFHCDHGFIDTESFIGKNYGDCVNTSLGTNFFLLKPPLYEQIMNLKRKTQIIYPKDIGFILMKAHIFPGAICIESGIGSGALTTAMANFVRPTGKVHSYERNIDFLNNAKKNLEKHGLTEYVEFNNMEISTEYPQKNADFVMIDIGSQWDLVPAAYNSLKGGRVMCAICPTFDQLTQTVFKMEEVGFVNIETVEIQVRRILVRRGRTRPEQHMPCHTGWLIFGYKACKPVLPQIEEIAAQDEEIAQENNPTLEN
jgi:tRNA (adenine57-N1/adenine58-N1)-methyltransferase